MYSSSSDEDLPRICVTGTARLPATKDGAFSSEPIILDDSDDENGGITCHPNRDTALPKVRSKRKLKPASSLTTQSNTKKKKNDTNEMVTLQKLEREQQKKKMDDALKKVVKETSKDNHSSERMKQMVVLLDTTLSENTNFMAEFVKGVASQGVHFRVCNKHMAGTVRWVRIMKERTVGEHAQIIEREIEEFEKDMLVSLEASGFVGLVQHSKEAVACNPLPVGAMTLEQFASGLCRDNPNARVSIAVEGLEAFLRSNKTRKNRQFKQACLEASGGHTSTSRSKNTPTTSMFGDVGVVDCEEALVRVELGSGCVVRMCRDSVALALYVLSLTKALCKAHYQKSNPFDFYAECGQGPSKKELASTDSKVCLIWKHQLMQFNNMSKDMAAAITNTYPSPTSLLEAYDKCSTIKEGEDLLKDILIRRGVGVVSSTRKLGPIQSKRIFTMMTSKDPKLLLS